MSQSPPVTASISPLRADDVSLGYLRAFVTLLVVLHHVLIGYAGLGALLGGDPSLAFTEPPMLWRAVPVSDGAHVWSGALLIVAFNDIYFMSLMFLLSGLFVNASVLRKGLRAFVRDRLLRLGLPFLFAAFVIAPAAYWFAWLQSGQPVNVMTYGSAWISLPDWPTGPAWFILVLLVFDLVVALVYAVAPRWAERAAHLCGMAAMRVPLALAALMATVLVLHAPLAIAFGAEAWFSFGPVQFQISRVMLYFLFFSLGIAIGTHGLGRGPLSRDGTLARLWWLWLAIVSPLAFTAGAAMTLPGPSGDADTRGVFALLGLVAFAIGVVATSFGWLGLFTRHVRTRSAIADSFSRNAYGIYTVHYVFVAAIQYAMLPLDTAPWLKALAVSAIVLMLSWMTSAVLRRVPVLSRLVGEMDGGSRLKARCRT